MRLYTSLWLRCEGKLIASHDTYKLSDWSQQPIGITEKYEARENASNRIAVGLRFVSDWLERWHEFF